MSKKLPVTVRFLVLTALTVLVWVGLGVYRSITTKPPSPVEEEVLVPLNPTLNTEILGKVRSRLYIEQ